MIIIVRYKKSLYRGSVYYPLFYYIYTSIEQFSHAIKHLFMKSTIKIDFDEDRMPIIVINHVESDDVRDKMVKDFMQSIPYEANCVVYRFFQHNDLPPNSRMIIRPKL